MTLLILFRQAIIASQFISFKIRLHRSKSFCILKFSFDLNANDQKDAFTGN